LRDGERFVEVGLAQPYRPTPPQGGTDEYRCFLVDPKLTAASYITGSQFLPDNGRYRPPRDHVRARTVRSGRSATDGRIDRR
jgi:hypothetical protein